MLATRPYEKKKGSSQKVFDKWMEIVYDDLKEGKISKYKQNIKNIISDFKQIPIELVDKPKVGIVGEILVKYHVFANDDLIGKLEAEGAEVSLPDLMGFVKYCAYNAIIKNRMLKTGGFTAFINQQALNIIDILEKPVKDGLKNTRYHSVTNIYELAKNVDGILSLGNQTGEGWFLTSEMVSLMKHGVPNIVCVQPFACLPNHIVGKSVIKKFRKLYPESNIVAIDYDPGASHTNQANRIKLMFTVARDNMKQK